ncbi:16S rRNA pseudouridine516 synthase [Neisseria sp. HSC-16F19]|nr:16S rRNA pseudouridine(516) synthase [Neisseria sp. HSC-16F19]MCP2039651.1 16S rRNA pseudouridine516 synthase [Neisseria sp. HSC-16F19]
MQFIKYLQAQGLGSRKLCRSLIDDGRIAVNGGVIEDDKAEIDPAAVHSLHLDDEALMVVPLPFFYVLLHKKGGYETSHKPQHHPSVFSLLPDRLCLLGIQAVGRLDEDTTGVLLLTNDGAFNHRMTSPKHKVPKRYRVTLKHAAAEDVCAELMGGVFLHDDEETVCADAAELADSHTLILTISQGRYHQVKRMVAAAGNRVEALHREAFGPWTLADLAPGEWCFFNPDAAA